MSPGGAAEVLGLLVGNVADGSVIRWSFGVLAAYLLGAVSFSYCIVRILKGIDIRTVGSGNAGATNVLRVAGKVPALVALVLDIGKGAVPIAVFRLLDAPHQWVAAGALAAVIGHVYPVYMGFRGGKGVATAVGTLAMLAWPPTLLLLVLFGLVVAVTRFVSLGSVVASAAAPLAMWIGGERGWMPEPAILPNVLATGVIGLVIVFKHRENIARLLSGSENRLGDRAKAGGKGA